MGDESFEKTTPQALSAGGSGNKRRRIGCVQEIDIERDGVRLRVRDHGGRGRHVVLLHGLASNAVIWDLVAARLAGRFRVVAYDQRNHGLSSDADDFGFDALAGDLDAVVEALGLDAPVVVGHSWGASVALHYAATRPSCTAAVGVDGGMLSLRERGVSWEQAERMLRPPDIEGPPGDVLARLRDGQPAVPWDAAEPVARRSFRVAEDGVMRRRLPVERHMRIVRAMWEQSLDDAYAAVRCSVMLVLAAGIPGDGRESAFVAAKREAASLLASRHPDVRVEWLESVHDIPLARPAELSELLGEFVDARA